MWPLLKLYWKKNYKSIKTAFGFMVLVGTFLTFFPLVTIYIVSLLFTTAFLAGLGLLESGRPAHSIAGRLVRIVLIGISVQVTWILAPLIVANLLNWVSISFLTGITFFLVADVMTYFTIGPAFSPIKLVLNPRMRLEALRPILEEHVIGVDRYVNILNELAAPGLETNPFYAKPLAGSEEEMGALLLREQHAIAQLPAALKIVHLEVSRREFLPEPGQGLDRETSLMEQKKAAYQAYRNQLTPAQQGHFDAYLDVTLSLTHAICVITRASPLVEPPEQFFILEKQYYTNEEWRAVPKSTHIFYNDPAEKDILLSLARYQPSQQLWTVKHPAQLDQLFRPAMYSNPVNGESNKTRYRCYAYQKIDEQHPMSLQICEAIEAFNRSMQVEPTAVVDLVTNNDVQLELVVAHQPSNARINSQFNMAIPSGVTVINMHADVKCGARDTPNSGSSLEFSSVSDEDYDESDEDYYGMQNIV